jgi:acyl-CoA thioesterase I
MEYQIFVIGDSIVFGKKDSLGGWVDRLKIKLNQVAATDNNFSANVYNLGIPGDTSKNLLNRFSNEILIRNEFYPDRKAILFIAFGANDAAFNKESNEFKVEPSEYRINILNCIKLAKKDSILPILLNITPVLPAVADKPDKYGNSRSSDHIQKYNLILDEISKLEGIELINLHEKFKTDTIKLICNDGLHPNSNGHELICTEVEKFLKSKQISS